MSFKSILALLILANYLLMAGMGWISKPEDFSYVLMLKSSSDQSRYYEQARYLRMDGIDEFITEALTNKYKELTNSNDQVVISFLTFVDTHFPPVAINFREVFIFLNEQVVYRHIPISPKSIALAIYSPPDAFQNV